MPFLDSTTSRSLGRVVMPPPSISSLDLLALSPPFAMGLAESPSMVQWNGHNA